MKRRTLIRAPVLATLPSAAEGTWRARPEALRKGLLQSEGGPFNPLHVYFEPNGNRWFGNEMQVYTDAGYSPVPLNPFAFDGGRLTITARPVPAEHRHTSPKPYISGCLETSKGPWWEASAIRNLRLGLEQKYGVWQIRCRIPRGRGLWGAFWLAGGIVGRQDMRYGEIDVFETLGHQPRTIYHTAHGNWSQLVKTADHREVRLTFDYSEAFHTYGLLWAADRIVWFVDGAETFRASADIVAQYRDHCGPMHLVVNLAVGGEWPGPPDRFTRFPAVMEIEWLKVDAVT